MEPVHWLAVKAVSVLFVDNEARVTLACDI